MSLSSTPKHFHLRLHAPPPRRFSKHLPVFSPGLRCQTQKDHILPAPSRLNSDLTSRSSSIAPSPFRLTSQLPPSNTSIPPFSISQNKRILPSICFLLRPPDRIIRIHNLDLPHTRRIHSHQHTTTFTSLLPPTNLLDVLFVKKKNSHDIFCCFPSGCSLNERAMELCRSCIAFWLAWGEL